MSEEKNNEKVSLEIPTVLYFVADCLLMVFIVGCFKSFEKVYLNVVLQDGLNQIFFNVYLVLFYLLVGLTLFLFLFFFFIFVVLYFKKDEITEEVFAKKDSILKELMFCFKTFIVFALITVVGLYIIRGEVVKVEDSLGSYAIQDAIVAENNSKSADIVRSFIEDYRVCYIEYTEKDFKKYTENLRVEDVLEIEKEDRNICTINHVTMKEDKCPNCGIDREKIYKMFFGAEHLLCSECYTEYSYGENTCKNCGNILNLFKMEN